MEQANIVISSYGHGIAVGLEGTKKQIERTFNRFFNWGAIGAAESVEYLHELSNKFSYFISTEENMIRAMTAENIVKWQDSEISGQYKTPSRHYKKNNGKKFLADAAQAARDEYESFKREGFMQFIKTPTYIYQQLDGGAPSWVSETED
jgi:hypothetical protein